MSACLAVSRTGVERTDDVEDVLLASLLGGDVNDVVSVGDQETKQSLHFFLLIFFYLHRIGGVPVQISHPCGFISRILILILIL